MVYAYFRNNLFRQQCRLDADDDSQDAVLELAAESAHDWVIAAIGRSEAEIFELWGRMPAPLVQAMLLIVGHNFAYREAGQAVSITSVPKAVHYLLSPYQKLRCI